MPVIWSAWIFSDLGDLWNSWKPVTNRITFYHGLFKYRRCCILLRFWIFALEIKTMGVGKSYWYSLDYYIISIGVNIFCDSVFNTEYGFLNVWVCLLIIKSLVLMNFNLIVVIYSRIVNLQIFLWLSLYIKEWSLLTTSLPPVSCWRCICSGIYDKLDFSIKKVLNHCVSQSCVVNSTCEFSQTFVKFCATVYCYHVFLC